jgi:hypothetical protein
MTTRMVSPKPLSDFVLEVTLIAFPIPAGLCPHGGRTFSARESLSVRVRKMVSILMLKAHSGVTLNRPWLEHVVRGVLDGCSWARNQAPRQNFIIH